MLNFENIRAYYKEFFEYINNTHSILSFLIIHLDKYLIECRKDCYDEFFTDNMEINLANLKNIYLQIDNVLDLAENITLLATQLPKKTSAKIYNIDDYVGIPNDYEHDCYVDFYDLPDFSKLWENRKPDLKLYINKESYKDKE